MKGKLLVGAVLASALMMAAPASADYTETCAPAEVPATLCAWQYVEEGDGYSFTFLGAYAAGDGFALSAFAGTQKFGDTSASGACLSASPVAGQCGVLFEFGEDRYIVTYGGAGVCVVRVADPNLDNCNLG